MRQFGLGRLFVEAAEAVLAILRRHLLPHILCQLFLLDFENDVCFCFSLFFYLVGILRGQLMLQSQFLCFVQVRLLNYIQLIGALLTTNKLLIPFQVFHFALVKYLGRKALTRINLHCVRLLVAECPVHISLVLVDSPLVNFELEIRQLLVQIRLVLAHLRQGVFEQIGLVY